jgi:hypothetical protein
MTTTGAREMAQTAPQAWSDADFKQYIADTLYRYVTRDGIVDPVEAYREVEAVTGRSYGTVKNWLYYRVNLPDLESLARIVHHWQIPADTVLHPDIVKLQEAPSGLTESDARPRLALKDQVLVSFYGTANHGVIDRALLKYTDHPRATMLVRQQSSDMQDEIRAGELMLIDAAVEQIDCSGLYLLRFADGERDTMCTRIVEVIAGQQAARLSCANPLMSGGTEIVRLKDGCLPEHITVLGRVVGVLRRI